MLTIEGAWNDASLNTNEPPHFIVWGEHMHCDQSKRVHLAVDNVLEIAEEQLGLQLSALRGLVQQEAARTNSVEAKIPLVLGTTEGLLLLLLSFGYDTLWESQGYRIGRTLQHWVRAARLALRLLNEGHFLPGMKASQSLAIWDALLDGPYASRQLLRLKELLPDVNGFIEVVIELFVRDSISANQARELMVKMNPRYVAPLTPSEHWLQACFGAPSMAAEHELEWIAEEVHQWRHDFVRQLQDHAFRTCLLLEEPTAEEVNWRLSFMLQAVYDPAVIIPAEQIWEGAVAGLPYSTSRLQEQLLADLWQASSLVPAIRDAMKREWPISCELDTETAYQFLSETTEQLQAAGFAIFIPAWWREPASRLQARLKISSDAHTVQTRMDFNAILSYEWQLSLGEEVISAEEFKQLCALKKPLVAWRGKWLELVPEQHQHGLELLEHQGVMKLAEALQLALQLKQNKVQAVKPYLPLPDLQFAATRIITDGVLNKLLMNIEELAEQKKLASPAALHGRLRDYQQGGFSWLVRMNQLQFGACLADDMGLGKTVQWIAYLLHLKEQNKLNGPVLLICPTSVLGNWQKELQRFSPGLQVLVHHGAGRSSGASFVRSATEQDVVLTTYATAVRDEAELAKLRWQVLTLDEAQNIKNSNTKQSRSIRSLPATHRIALTGTPVENHLSELWTVMDFLNPGYLGSKEQFHHAFVIPIERGQQLERLQQLQQLIQPFILRREKSDRKVIHDIPDKVESTVACALTGEQAALYEARVQATLDRLTGLSGMQRRGVILSAITHLKQICNHPAHFLGESELSGERSGKLIKLESMLTAMLAKGERCLIFTQYAQMAILLQRYLAKRFQQEVLLIHGRVPKKKRDQFISRFQEAADAPSIFVLSLKTGGFGLNLTRANHVIHFDRWWNPAVENQATDRAYRIGQLQDVQVHKFLCSGTLEDHIEQLLESKRSLAEQVIGQGEKWLTELSTDELKHIFALRNAFIIEDEATGGIKK